MIVAKISKPNSTHEYFHWWRRECRTFNNKFVLLEAMPTPRQYLRIDGRYRPNLHAGWFTKTPFKCSTHEELAALVGIKNMLRFQQVEFRAL